MDSYRVSQAAALLGVSDDSVRRLIDAGTLPATKDEAGRTVVAGPDLAVYAASRPSALEAHFGGEVSARNRLVGIVTDVRSDSVMSQVQLRCGPFTITSLISTDAVRAQGLEVGRLAVAVIKSTTVILETAPQEKNTR